MCIPPGPGQDKATESKGYTVCRLHEQYCGAALFFYGAPGFPPLPSYLKQ
jgi:hypothetical protein